MSKHVAVLGYGVTGESVVRHLLREDTQVTVIDTRPARVVDLEAVTFLWNTRQWPNLAVDFAVVSPGLAMDDCLVAGAKAAGVTLVSDIDLFFAAADAPVIGVTGTNGKSTVTSMVGHLLQTSGVSCGVGGNLGVAALDIIDPSNDFYVLELSSFQLERSQKHSFRAATILNLTEDHLDKHADMHTYALSKHRIYATSEMLVYNREDALTRPTVSGRAVSFGPGVPPTECDWGIQIYADAEYLVRGATQICRVDQLSLPGLHNQQNALAACALVEGIVQDSQLPAALASFKGLRHRFERVASADGVVFINDSKATNLGATIAALEGIPANNQVILIAGGDAKGVDLQPLARVLVDRVRHMVTLGQDGPLLAQVARSAGVPTTPVKYIEDAVVFGAQLARDGDMVLLSPACASLDMFANYAQRGDAFAQAARELCAQRGVR